MSKVAGKNVIIYIKSGSDWVLYACAMSATLNVVTDLIETSVSGTGRFATFIPTKNSFTGILEGVTSLEQSPKLSLPDLRQRQLAQEHLLMRYQRTDADGNLYTEEASFYIASSSDSGSFDAMNLFTIELQGTGILSLTPSVTPTPVPFTFYYGAGELSTVVTGLPGTLPTEDNYTDSILEVFEVGDELTGTSNEGEDISVDDFENATDKIVFVEYPNTEDPVLFWSEEGNPLQQHQPIDQAFVYGSSNVFFISARLDYYVVISYVQTTFAGKLTFSR